MVDDYETRAQQAEEAARRAMSEEERETHLKVAALWRELAVRKRKKAKRD
jgi:hypothetical protein